MAAVVRRVSWSFTGGLVASCSLCLPRLLCAPLLRLLSVGELGYGYGGGDTWLCLLENGRVGLLVALLGFVSVALRMGD